jgi:hypothetical protein
MPLRLFDPEKREFLITLTIDISRHGACVMSKNSWQPNANISVHSMGGSLYSSARVAHCRSLKDSSYYAVGLELVDPSPDWIEFDEQLSPKRWTAAWILSLLRVNGVSYSNPCEQNYERLTTIQEAQAKCGRPEELIQSDYVRNGTINGTITLTQLWVKDYPPNVKHISPGCAGADS